MHQHFDNYFYDFILVGFEYKNFKHTNKLMIDFFLILNFYLAILKKILKNVEIYNEDIDFLYFPLACTFTTALRLLTL